MKTVMSLRQKYNLPKWVAITDLVKAFYTSNYALLIAILGKYGAFPILCSTIKRLYYKRIVKLIIEKVETSIDFNVGFKQVDIMDPVIFLFLMMAFSETL